MTINIFVDEDIRMTTTMTDRELYNLGCAAHEEIDDFLPVVTFALGWEDGRVDFPHWHACHGIMMNLCHSMPNYISPIVMAHKYDPTYCNWTEKVEFYYDYLFNDSPFSSVFLSKTADECLIKEDGIIVRLDRPANLAIAGAIGTRHPWEHKKVVDSFYNLVNAGLDKHKAFLTAFLVKYNEGNDWTPWTTEGHTCTYVRTMTKDGVRNFLNQELPSTRQYNCGTYKELNSYKGIPFMWNTKDGCPRGDSALRDKFGVQGGMRPAMKDPFGVLPNIAKKGKEKDVATKINEIFEAVLE